MIRGRQEECPSCGGPMDDAGMSGYICRTPGCVHAWGPSASATPLAIDRERWSESLRSAIQRHLDAASLDSGDPRDAQIDAVFCDVVAVLGRVESRLAWLRYVAECDSAAFASGDAGMLAHCLANPLEPAPKV